MDLDDLIFLWKKQNEKMNEPLTLETVRYLLQKKSHGALSKIKNHLTREAILISIALIVSNALFILVHLPLTVSRWSCLIIFNLILLWYLYYYFKAIFSMFAIRYNEDLSMNIKRLIENLRFFRNKYKLLNVPVIILCIVMFTGSQNLFILIPWMVAEFFMWRSIFLPKLLVRFESYKTDLEYSLRNLQELSEY